jgi:hypothetical protein
MEGVKEGPVAEHEADRVRTSSQNSTGVRIGSKAEVTNDRLHMFTSYKAYGVDTVQHARHRAHAHASRARDISDGNATFWGFHHLCFDRSPSPRGEAVNTQVKVDVIP